MKTKRIITIVACVAMVLSLTACGGKNPKVDEANTNTTAETTEISLGGVQIANPWTECADINEAVSNAGFAFEVPETIGEYKIAFVQNMGKEMIDVIYYEADSCEKSIHIRKGIGTGDVSGDYNEYSESNKVTVGDYEVTLKGNDGTVSLATWTDGEYSYALSIPEMNSDDVTTIIGQIR